jgi:hypothetical protein
MNSSSHALKPIDVPVALRLAQKPEAKYAELGHDMAISSSQSFASVKRLQYAGLVRPGSRSVNRLALGQFLEHGLRYAFPARPGAQARGIPTSHAGPPLARNIHAEDSIVWPDPDGQSSGASIAPLYSRAAMLPERCPELYEVLTLADALRVGRARERKLAFAELGVRLGLAGAP